MQLTTLFFAATVAAAAISERAGLSELSERAAAVKVCKNGTPRCCDLNVLAILDLNCVPRTQSLAPSLILEIKANSHSSQGSDIPVQLRQAVRRWWQEPQMLQSPSCMSILSSKPSGRSSN
jgi:hypothetical protein